MCINKKLIYYFLNNMSKLQKLHFQLSLAFILLFSVLISGIFIFSPISLTQVAQALDPANYNKTTGASLTATDWNRLDDDFMATNGSGMKMVCGSMPLTLANTTNPFSRTLLVTVNTSSANFNSVPTYLSSMDGIGNHYRATGVNTIYNPQTNSYQIYLQWYNYDNPSYLITPQDAINWGWIINWCGIGD
jgi:hypothetical protein